MTFDETGPISYILKACEEILVLVAWTDNYLHVSIHGISYVRGPRLHYFSGMDRHEDFLRLKMQLNKNK